MDYSYQLLPILVAIIEEKHMGKAAHRLGISQPAISRALSKLREQYQDPLVTRTATGVEPTSFAQRVYPTILKSLSDLDATFSSNVAFNPHARPYRFSIACTSLVNYSFIPKVVEAFANLYPLININIHLLGVGDILSQLRAKECDFVIDMDIGNIQNLNKKTIFEDQLVLCCRKDHPRIKTDRITIQEYLKEQHVTVNDWKSQGYVLTNEHIQGIDARKVSATTVGTIESLCLVGRTDFVCLSDATNVDIFSDTFSIKSVQLPFENTEYGVCLYWHPSRSNDQSNHWFRYEIERLFMRERVNTLNNKRDFSD